MSESIERVPNTFDIEGIMDYLPHRYPILLVDRILDCEPGKWVRGLKNVTIGEQVFLGHFPKKRIFPGVYILEAMAQTGGFLMIQGLPDRHSKLFYFMSIDKVKFRKPVVPGDQMIMEVKVLSSKGRVCKVRGEAFVNGQKVAEAELTSMMVDVETSEAK
jgi:beta-hydroxyacyl-ACP dehydratase FabZ